MAAKRIPPPAKPRARKLSIAQDALLSTLARERDIPGADLDGLERRTALSLAKLGYVRLSVSRGRGFLVRVSLLADPPDPEAIARLRALGWAPSTGQEESELWQKVVGPDREFDVVEKGWRWVLRQARADAPSHKPSKKAPAPLRCWSCGEVCHAFDGDEHFDGSIETCHCGKPNAITAFVGGSWALTRPDGVNEDGSLEDVSEDDDPKSQPAAAVVRILPDGEHEAAIAKAREEGAAALRAAIVEAIELEVAHAKNEKSVAQYINGLRVALDLTRDAKAKAAGKVGG